MRLLCSGRSPYARKVMIAVHELGLSGRVALEKLVVTIRDLNVNPANPNPFGQIPTLVTDAGDAIYDSLVICDYLATFAGSSWMFDGPLGRIDILTRHSAAQSILDMQLKRYSERNRGSGAETEYAQAYRIKSLRGLDMLEQNAGNWMQTPLEIGQINIACVLSYMDFRFAEDEWRHGRPKLTEWYEQVEQRSSMLATAFGA